jgi:hypothetical protein
MTTPDFDLQAAHRYFSVECFTKAWELIDKPSRTPAEEVEMVHFCLVSLWHWTQRTDCSRENLSIGYWQASRVYALVRQPENARRYGQLCLEASQGEGPFFLGYAYEALARAERLAGNQAQAAAHLAEAQRWAAQVPTEDDRQLLLNDLATI